MCEWSKNQWSHTDENLLAHDMQLFGIIMILGCVFPHHPLQFPPTWCLVQRFCHRSSFMFSISCWICMWNLIEIAFAPLVALLLRFPAKSYLGLFCILYTIFFSGIWSDDVKSYLPMCMWDYWYATYDYCLVQGENLKAEGHRISSISSTRETHCVISFIVVLRHMFLVEWFSRDSIPLPTEITKEFIHEACRPPILVSYRL